MFEKTSAIWNAAGEFHALATRWSDFTKSNRITDNTFPNGKVLEVDAFYIYQQKEKIQVQRK